MSIADEFEERVKFKQKDENSSKQIFDTRGSAGNNQEKLARILASWSIFINIMGWQGKPATNNNLAEPPKPLANLIQFLEQYQGSVNAKYHNDYKDIQIALEVEKRRAERKGISILQQ